MAKSQSETVHKKTHIVWFDHKELELLVAKIAGHSFVEHFDIDVEADGVSYKVVFEDQTEGSPSYRVGTKATVTITENLDPLTETGTDQ